MNQKTFNQLIDAGKFIVGSILLTIGFFNNQDQFLMIIGATLIAISGIEIKVGKLNVNAPSKRKRSKK